VFGEVSFSPGTRITLERISAGPLRIIAVASRRAESAGVLHDSGGNLIGSLGPYVVMTISNVEERAKRGHSVVLPVLGSIEVGRSGPNPAGRAMLRSGTVTLLGQSLLGSSRYAAGTADLRAGDRFTVLRPHGPAVGFMQVDERPALTVAYRVLGTSGQVSRFASKGYSVGTSLRERVLSDSVLQGLWLTTVALLTLAAKATRRHAQA
jgi:hypothetical protein